MIQTTTTYNKQKYISLGIITAVILVWITVFHHTIYDAVPKEIENIIISHKKVKKLRNDTSNASFPLIQQFADGKLTKEEFLKKSSDLEKGFLQYKRESSTLFKKTRALQAEYQIFGFDSYNIFSFQLSARIVLFLCALLLIISIRIKEKSQSLTKALNFAACNILIICAFYTVWVFYKGNDLSILAYYSIMLISALVSGISVYYAINAIYKNIKKRVKRNEEVILRNQEIGIDIKLAFDLLAQKVADEKLKK